MQTLAISNLKGGVGKTTLTFSLGAALAERGHSVLLIDGDSQCSLSRCLGLADTDGPTLADVLRGQATVGTAAVRTSIPRLWAVAGSPRLGDINRRNLAGERVLLARMPATCDFALIDCPSAEGVVMVNAFVAAQSVLVPVAARGMAREGVDRLMRLITSVRRHGTNSTLDILGIVVNQFERRMRLAREVRQALDGEYPGLLLDNVVHDAVEIGRSTDVGQPVTEFSTDSRGARDIRAVSTEILKRLEAGYGYYGPPPQPAAAKNPRKRPIGSVSLRRRRAV